jgi:hypothetical protein
MHSDSAEMISRASRPNTFMRWHGFQAGIRLLLPQVHAAATELEFQQQSWNSARFSSRSRASLDNVVNPLPSTCYAAGIP